MALSTEPIHAIVSVGGSGWEATFPVGSEERYITAQVAFEARRAGEREFEHG